LTGYGCIPDFWFYIAFHCDLCIYNFTVKGNRVLVAAMAAALKSKVTVTVNMHLRVNGSQEKPCYGVRELKQKSTTIIKAKSNL